MCDVSKRAEEGIKCVAVKAVRFLVGLGIHGTEELIDEASFSPDFIVGFRSY